MVFWFWFVLLGFISFFALLWRLTTIVSSKVRFALIYKTVSIVLLSNIK